MENDVIRIETAELQRFCAEIFAAHQLRPQDAKVCAEVLVAADVRGIPSHGVARLPRYVNGLRSGQMKVKVKERVLCETGNSLVIDADGGMGAPVSIRTMRKVIDKAEHNNLAFACVRNSNHFGIAAYYAMMAMDHDMIAVAMTNTAALGVPTFGREVMTGTNPLAFFAPANHEKAFVLDMSTTAVSRGKLEVYAQKGLSLPTGWAVDDSGLPGIDAAKILDDMFNRSGGGLLPLGGFGEISGGHKGYGLSVMVDILCAVLCAAQFGNDISDQPETSARVSHCFGAMKISAFREPDEFRRDMDVMLRRLRETPPAQGEKKVYFAGQKEFEHEQQVQHTGVPLLRPTYETLMRMGMEYNTKLELIKC